MKNAVYIALSLALLTRLLSVNDYRYGHFVPPLDFPALENSAKPAPEARAPRYPAVLLFIIDGATRGAAEVLAAVLDRAAGVMLIGAATAGDARWRSFFPLGDRDEIGRGSGRERG